MLEFKNKFLFIIISFILIGLFIYFSASVILVPDFFQGISFPDKTNNFCSITPDLYIDRLTCKNKYKKSNFIWIFLDGLAYDQLVRLKERKKYNIANLFKITTEQYRQSGSLHETYLTGKFSRNFPAEEIKIDHIFKQTKSFNTVYEGTNFPLYFLLGKEERNIVKEFKINKSETFPFKNMCEYSSPFVYNVIDANKDFSDLLEDGKNLRPDKTVEDFYNKVGSINKNTVDSYGLNQCLETLLRKENSRSLIFYTMIIDHLNHSFYKYSANVLAHTYSIELGLLALMDWVESHPEYALIFSSDHGGQKFNGEDNICNHGCLNPGNEAIFSVFTYELSRADYIETEISGDIEDIAPTVSTILENVNIPLEANGMPLFLHKDPFYKILSLRAKENQLKEYLKAFISDSKGSLKYLQEKFEESEFNKVLSKFTSEDDIINLGNVESFILKYKDFIKSQGEEIRKIIKIKGQSFNNKIFTIITICIVTAKFVALLITLNKNLNRYICQSNTKTNTNTNTNTKTNSITDARIILKVFKGETLFIYFLLFFEFIMIILIKNSSLIQGLKFNYLIYFFFVCGISFYYLFLSNKDETTGNYTYLRKFVFLTFIISISIFIVDRINIYHNLKLLFSNFQLAKKLDILNYSIFISYLLYESKKFKNFYLAKEIALNKILVFFYIILLPLMIYFDYSFPEHFINQTFELKIIVRTIYVLILIFLLFTMKGLYYSSSKGRFYTGICFSVIKYPLIIYIFFLCDEAERLYTIIIILPVFHFLTHSYKEFQDWKTKLICAISLITVSEIFYTLNQGTLSFDVSLKVCTKSIGDYPDQTPIFTGFLMGTHKMRLFILLTGYVLEFVNSINYESLQNSQNIEILNYKFLKKDSYMIVIMMDLKLTLLIIIYFCFLYYDEEEFYLTIFIWAGTKSLCLLLMELVLIYHYFCLTAASEKKENKFTNVELSYIPQSQTDLEFEDFENNII